MFSIYVEDNEEIMLDWENNDTDHFISNLMGCDYPKEFTDDLDNSSQPLLYSSSVGEAVYYASVIIATHDPILFKEIYTKWKDSKITELKEKQKEEIRQKMKQKISKKMAKKEKPKEEQKEEQKGFPDLKEYPTEFIEFLDNKKINIMGVEFSPSNILIGNYPMTLYMIFEEWQKWEN